MRERITSNPGLKPLEEPLDQELELSWRDCGQPGAEYDLFLGRISRIPVVRSHTTGKYFMLPWSRIIEWAVQKGIAKK